MTCLLGKTWMECVMGRLLRTESDSLVRFLSNNCERCYHEMFIYKVIHNYKQL